MRRTWLRTLVISCLAGIAITVALSFVPNFFYDVCTSWGRGWPLAAYRHWDPCLLNGRDDVVGVDVPGAVLDVTFWSIAAAAIIRRRRRPAAEQALQPDAHESD